MTIQLWVVRQGAGASGLLSVRRRLSGSSPERAFKQVERFVLDGAQVEEAAAPGVVRLTVEERARRGESPLLFHCDTPAALVAAVLALKSGAPPLTALAQQQR